MTKSFHNTAYPFWKSKAFVSDNFFILQGFISSRVSIVKENQELKKKLSEAEFKMTTIPILVTENRQLRNLLDREESYQTLSAFVLSKPPQTPYDILIIDVGKSSGLKGGEKILFKNVILGEIIQVFEKTAKVKLLSSGGTETRAYIERIELPITAIGKGGGNFESNLPKEVQVEIGDFLIIPGEFNRLLGQVEEIERTPAASFLKILFRLPLNLSEIRWVSVEIL